MICGAFCQRLRPEFSTQFGYSIWTSESTAIANIATERTVTVPAPAAHRFYLLTK